MATSAYIPIEVYLQADYEADDKTRHQRGDFARRAGFSVAFAGTRTTGVMRCISYAHWTLECGKGDESKRFRRT